MGDFMRGQEQAKTMTSDECGKMLSAARNSGPDFKQNFVLIYLMFMTGLRSSELISLTTKQIDLEQGCINVKDSKSRSPRIVFLSNVLKEEMKKYLSHPLYTEWANTGHDEVFFHNNRKLNNRSLNIIIKSICLAAGINTVTSRDIRATLAKLMYDQGVHIEVISHHLCRRPLTTLDYLMMNKSVSEKH